MAEIANLAALLLRIAGASAALAGAPQIDLGIQALEFIGKTLNDLVKDANKALGLTEELRSIELELREANDRERAKNAAKRAAKTALYEERKRLSELEERANQLRKALGGDAVVKPPPFVSLSSRKLARSEKVVSFADEGDLSRALAADAAAAPGVVPRLPPGAVAVMPAQKGRSLLAKMRSSAASRDKNSKRSGDTPSREDPADS